MRVLLGAQLGHFALGQLGTARKVAATFAQRAMDGNKGLLAVSSANATVKRLDEVIEAVRCLAHGAREWDARLTVQYCGWPDTARSGEVACLAS